MDNSKQVRIDNRKVFFHTYATVHNCFYHLHNPTYGNYWIFKIEKYDCRYVYLLRIMNIQMVI